MYLFNFHTISIAIILFLPSYIFLCHISLSLSHSNGFLCSLYLLFNFFLCHYIYFYLYISRTLNPFLPQFISFLPSLTFVLCTNTSIYLHVISFKLYYFCRIFSSYLTITKSMYLKAQMVTFGTFSETPTSQICFHQHGRDATSC